MDFHQMLKPAEVSTADLHVMLLFSPSECHVVQQAPNEQNLVAQHGPAHHLKLH